MILFIVRINKKVNCLAEKVAVSLKKYGGLLLVCAEKVKITKHTFSRLNGIMQVCNTRLEKCDEK